MTLSSSRSSRTPLLALPPGALWVSGGGTGRRAGVGAEDGIFQPQPTPLTELLPHLCATPDLSRELAKEPFQRGAMGPWPRLLTALPLAIHSGNTCRRRQQRRILCRCSQAGQSDEYPSNPALLRPEASLEIITSLPPFHRWGDSRERGCDVSKATEQFRVEVAWNRCSLCLPQEPTVHGRHHKKTGTAQGTRGLRMRSRRQNRTAAACSAGLLGNSMEADVGLSWESG